MTGPSAASGHRAAGPPADPAPDGCDPAAILESAARSAGFAYWTWDCDVGRGDHASETLASIYGLTPGEFLAERNDTELGLARLHPEDRMACRAAMSMLRMGRPFTVDYRTLSRDAAERWLRETGEGLTFQSGGRRKAVSILQDITELRKAQSELRQYEGLIRQTQKMDSLGTLAGGMAHDFANVLQPIILATEDAVDALHPEHPARHGLESALAASERAGEMIRRLLDFSRGKAVTAEPHDLAKLIDEAVALVRRTIPSSIVMDVEIDPQIGVCELTPSEATQIIFNLAANASQAMDGKGKLSIRLCRRIIGTTWQAMGMRLPPGVYACLTVQDDGPGMPAWLRERIFEPFFTTKPAGEGTGLGLAVVHGLVRQRNGAIRVDSAPSKGARFTIHLPFWPAQARPEIVCSIS